MRLDNLKWIKNVKHQGTDKEWAYDKLEEMQIPKARIFCLNWRSEKDTDNAKKPQTGELMLLLQKARVTHVVKFIDEDVYQNSPDEWAVYRVVKTLWMPHKDFDWSTLPHQRELFGSDHVVEDGAAHDLSAHGKMHNFHQHWDEKGGLEAFQKRVKNMLEIVGNS